MPPRKLPTAVRVLHGTARPSDLEREPHPDGRLPVMPRDMDAGAERAWRRAVRAMRATGALTRADRDVLRAYAEAVSRYERLVSELGDAPLLLPGREHTMVRNPLVAMTRDAADQVRMLARELGLTPASRAGLKLTTAPLAPDEQAFDTFLRTPVDGPAGSAS